MGKKLSELNQQNSATQEEYLLIDKDNQNESYKIKLKDIDITNFLKGYLVNEIEEAKNELGGISLYEGIQALFDNVPHTHFTNRITSNNTTQAPTVKAVYDYILENGGGGGGGTGTGGSGIKEKVDNPKLWELTSGMYEVTSGFYYTVDNYQSLENTSAILFIGDDSPEQDINYFMIAGRVKYYGVTKIDGSDGTIVTEDFSNEEINENSTNKDIPSSKAVYDFVKTEIKIPTFENPKLWELKPSCWYYIYNGFYYGSDQYQPITDGMLFITGNIEWSYIFITTQGKFWGTFKVENNKVIGTCNKELFTTQINIDSPTDERYPSEKAIIDYVKGQINNLVDTAPETLNTLNELANALNNDENFASTVMKQIGEKIDKETITTEVSGNSTDDEIVSAKAIYDFVTSYVNTKAEIPIVQNPKLWELEKGWYYIDSGFYYSELPSLEECYQELLPEGIAYIYQGIDCNYYIWDKTGYRLFGSVTQSDDGYNGYCKKQLMTSIIDENSTDEEFPTTKAVYDFVQTQKSIKSVVNPNIWDLDFGVYRVSDGCYYSYQANDDGMQSPDGSIEKEGYITILREAILFVYQPSSIEINGGTICSFILINDDVFYCGNISENQTEFNGNMITNYIGYVEKTFKTTTINENSTNEEYPSAKAVYDFVSNNVSEKKYIVSDTYMLDLETNIYEIEVDNSVMLTFTDDKTLELGEGLVVNNSYELDGSKANYGLILGNTTSGEPVYMYYIVNAYVAEIVNILKDYALDKEVDAKISALEDTIYKKQYLESDTLLTDLDTGIYTVNYKSPINLIVSNDKIIKIAGSVFNQKSELYNKDILAGYVYQGIIIGDYNNGDNYTYYNGIIYYYLTTDIEGTVIYINEFTDLNEDFIKEENITKEISSSSTHSQIPTAKAVYENLEQKSQVQIITWEEND